MQERGRAGVMTETHTETEAPRNLPEPSRPAGVTHSSPMPTVPHGACPHHGTPRFQGWQYAERGADPEGSPRHGNTSHLSEGGRGSDQTELSLVQGVWRPPSRARLEPASWASPVTGHRWRSPHALHDPGQHAPEPLKQGPIPLSNPGRVLYAARQPLAGESAGKRFAVEGARERFVSSSPPELPSRVRLGVLSVGESPAPPCAVITRPPEGVCCDRGSLRDHEAVGLLSREHSLAAPAAEVRNETFGVIACGERGSRPLLPGRESDRKGHPAREGEEGRLGRGGDLRQEAGAATRTHSL